MKPSTFFVSIVLVLSCLTAGPAGVCAGSFVPRFQPRETSATQSGVAPSRAASVSAPYREQPSIALNDYQKRRLELFLAGTRAVDDALSVITMIGIQVQFADSLMGGQGEGSRAELHDSLYFANELRHVEEYYDGASRKHLKIYWEVTGEIYNLPEGMGHYGDDEYQDSLAVEMMQSVIDSSDDDIDFSRYDAVMLIHAGAGQETDILDNSRTQLWSSFYSTSDIDAAFPDSTVLGLATDDSLGGKPFLVDNFMLVPESASQDDFTIGSLGIWVFEVGSRLGLLPLSDSTPPGRPDSRGASSYDLMAAGLYNGPVVVDEFSRPVLYPGFLPGFPSLFNRVIAGWIDPLEVEQAGVYALHDLNSPIPGDTSCIKIRVSDSEYYLIENRVHDTNFDSLFTFGDIDNDFWPDNEDSLGGAEFDFFLTVLTDPFEIRADPDLGGAQRVYVDTGTGMYVWHIDETVIWQTLMTGHLPNDFVSRKGVDLEEADGVQDLDGTGDPFSFGSHFDSFRESNNAEFGPDTKPSSASNSDASTGIVVSDISKIGTVMTFSVGFAAPYEDARTRWNAGASYQPPSPIDLDGDNGLEIIVLGDTADVYAFTAGGLEFVDTDADPETIEPYITAPGARWIGAPAFGDIDGDGGAEIVACDERGAVYAWNLDGSEVVDGDADPETSGVLYQGGPLASPPMLVDVNADGAFETVFVERTGVTLVAKFVNGEGGVNQPSGADFAIVWGEAVQAQFSSPLAYGALGPLWDDNEGVAFAWADTVDGYAGFSYLPIRSRDNPADLTPATYEWTPKGDLPTAFPAASSIAVGDFDGNGFDEAAFTLDDGRLVIYDWKGQGLDPERPRPEPLEFVDLRSSRPSAPAIGDVDGDGTLEILFWDDDYSYLYEYNARLGTNWPQPLRLTELGDYPDLVFDARLTSPLIGDIDGHDRVEILFPRGDGTVYAFDSGGQRLTGLQHVAPDGLEATPSIGDLAGEGSLSLVTVGRTTPFSAIDAVGDSIVTSPPMLSLSIQTLPGSQAGGNTDWFSYQHDLTRQGRWVRTAAPQTAANAVEPGSFKIYPNPVTGEELHARVVLNSQATVRVEVYNLEGERASSTETSANPGGVIQTPFDEIVDVRALKSGVYMLRLVITTPKGTESLVGNFAILR